MSLKENQYYGITSESITTENFTISLTNHAPNSSISLHAHDNPYLCFLATGAYKEESNSVDILSQGDVIYRVANYEHSNSFSDQGGLCLNIELNDYDQFMNRNELHLPFEVSKQKGVIELYKLFYGLKHHLPNDIINIYCYESLIAVINKFNGKGDLHWVIKVKERINDNPLESISLDKLSIEFSLHPNYIVRKFKEITGLKLSEYLTKIRLEHAMKYMMSNEENITTIALESGFYDQSHFNKHFKKHFEATPNHFRKVLRG